MPCQCQGFGESEQVARLVYVARLIRQLVRTASFGSIQSSRGADSALSSPPYVVILMRHLRPNLVVSYLGVYRVALLRTKDREPKAAISGDRTTRFVTYPLASTGGAPANCSHAIMECQRRTGRRKGWADEARSGRIRIRQRCRLSPSKRLFTDMARQFINS